MEIPMTARRCAMPKARVTSWCSDSTMSRTVKRGKCMCGCAALFEGEDDTPSPSASTRITKYFEESTSFPGPTRPGKSLVVPVNQVGKSTAFDFAAFQQGKAILGTSFDHTMVQNGDYVQLTVTLLGALPSSGDEFVIESKDSSGNRHSWPVMASTH
jgi:hypothetical protein